MSKVRFGVWAAVVLMIGSVAGAQSYTITDLGTFPGGNYSQAASLNNHGTVVGYANLPSAVTHAFVWTSTQGLRDIGTLDGPAVDSFAEGINNSNQVVGYSYLGNDTNTRAFLWTSKAGMRSLGTLGGNSSFAAGVNDSGEVVGASLVSQGSSEQRPFVWKSAEGMKDLGTLGGTQAQATAINNSGAVVGYSYLSNNIGYHAFLWTPTGGIQDLGTLGGENSFAYAINDKNQVVGYADLPSGHETAFIWDANKGMQSLGASAGAAAGGINDSDQAVGSGETLGGAFVWTATQHVQALVNLIPPDGGWTLSSAAAINQSGQIITFGLINDEQHGALLSPVN